MQKRESIERLIRVRLRLTAQLPSTGTSTARHEKREAIAIPRFQRPPNAISTSQGTGKHLNRKGPRCSPLLCWFPPSARRLAYADLPNGTLPARWSPWLHTLDSIGYDQAAPGCVLHVSPGKRAEQRAPVAALLRGPHSRRPQGERRWARYRPPRPLPPCPLEARGRFPRHRRLKSTRSKRPSARCRDTSAETNAAGDAFTLVSPHRTSEPCRGFERFTVPRTPSRNRRLAGGNKATMRRQSWASPRRFALVALALLSHGVGAAEIRHRDGVHRAAKVDPLVTPAPFLEKRDHTACPTSYSLCSPDQSGGCCGDGYSCAVDSCYATTEGPVTCAGRVGYHACGVEVGGK